MRAPALLCIAFSIFAGCARTPVDPAPGAETVQVTTSHPGAGFVELGPVTGVDGKGCGDNGIRGNRDGAIVSLMKNAFAMGGSYVQVATFFEPRKMGDCFVNTYRINGTAYRQVAVKAAPAPASAAQPGGSGDVVQSLRELQKL